MPGRSTCGPRARDGRRAAVRANPNLAESQFGRRLRQLAAGLGLAGGGGGLRLAIDLDPSNAGASNPGARALANRPATAKPIGHAPRARARPTGAVEPRACRHKSRSRLATIPPRSSTRGGPFSLDSASGSATCSSDRRTSRRVRPISRSKRSTTRRGSRGGNSKTTLVQGLHPREDRDARTKRGKC